jgi:N-glycosylase/DNA lyase
MVTIIRLWFAQNDVFNPVRDKLGHVPTGAFLQILVELGVNRMRRLAQDVDRLSSELREDSRTRARKSD